MKRVAVIGDGGWGTALALVAHRNGHRVCVGGPFEEQAASIMRERENKTYLPGVELPEAIEFSADPAHVLEAADAVLFVMPSKFYTQVLSNVAAHIPSAVWLMRSPVS